MPLAAAAQNEPSLSDIYLRTLADWGVHLERHFRTPQDIEWVLDRDDALWIVQSRPLANADAGRAKARSLPKTEPKLAGGRTVYPGRTSGPAFLVDEIRNIGEAPAGAVVFIRKPSPEVSRPGESHPEPLSEPYLNLSAHTAPAMEPRRTPICQCANSFESRREMRATQCVALRR